jgi:hypothetical protein
VIKNILERNKEKIYKVIVKIFTIYLFRLCVFVCFGESRKILKILSKLVLAVLTRIITNNGDTLKIGMFWVSPVFCGEWVRTKKVNGASGASLYTP